MNVTNTIQLIDRFLSIKRFAMVGVSRKTNDFSGRLFSEFVGRGYEVIPVNPNAEAIQGSKCYPQVQQIRPPVPSALVMTSPDAVEQILHDCSEAGISLVWMYGVGGEKRSHQCIVKIFEELGIQMIAGYCPYMFFPSSSFLHRLHGAVWKFTGKYPS